MDKDTPPRNNARDNIEHEPALTRDEVMKMRERATAVHHVEPRHAA